MIFPEALPTWALFGEIFVASLVVVVAGGRFTQLADTMAAKLNIASGWLGLLLLATVTSLPELVSSSTATWIGNVDLALGGILGSCAFNITLIVLLNALWRRGSVVGVAGSTHVLTGSFGVGLVSFTLLGMVILQTLSERPTLAGVSEIFWAAGIAVAYLGCMRLTYRFERKLRRASPALPEAKVESRLGLYLQVALMAVIIVAASWWLARLCDTLSTHRIELIGRPLGATFVGAFFLAVATSLPEIVTSVAAVRLGNLDMALGNIFGSNMFNIFVIPLLKGVSLAHGESRLFANAALDHTQNLLVGLMAIMLTAVALGGLVYKSERRLLQRFGLDSILIAVIYLGGMTLLLLKDG